MLLIGGVIMLGIGLRAIATAFAEMLAAIMSGSGSIFDFDLDTPMMRLSAVGGAMVMAGIVFFFMARTQQKELNKHRDGDVDTQLQVQTILREMGLDAAGNRVAETADTASRYCVQCGKPIDKADYQYCPYCGAKAMPAEAQEVSPRQEVPRKCMYCGKQLDEGEDVCSLCGHKTSVD